MRKLIYQQQAVERILNKLDEVFQYPKTEYAEGYVNACNAVLKMLDSLHPAQPEIIRCRDCKHRDAEAGFCEGRGWPMQLVPDDGFCDKGERREA